ncbi:DUF63 domain-containing protein [Halobacteriales archaeon QS_1_68_17]|nr:MAG: DUF63 domain-containing protein [Halobacteriales archaeon QS_1_68_17]
MVLPSGLVVPPLPVLVALAALALGVTAALLRLHPAANVLFQLGALPGSVGTAFSAPSVYVTTYVVAGAAWLAATGAADARVDRGRVPLWHGAAGTAVAAVAVGLVGSWGLAAGRFSPLWPAAGTVAAALLTAGTYLLIARARESVVDETGTAGALVVFGHALDGVSTAIGIDVFGTAERTPLPRAIMGFAGTLPTADALGVGWLFVLVKLGVSAAVVALIAPSVARDRTRGYLLLGAVAAFGLGPGVHNLLLFAVS